MTEINPNLKEALNGLEEKEQLESLNYLVDRLPKIADSMRVIEDKTDFLISTLTDTQSLSVIADEAESKVKNLEINEEHFEALLTLTKLLPRLAPMVEQVDNIAAFLEDVASDEKTVTMLIDGLNDLVPVKESIEVLDEAKLHFEETKDSSDISIFGLMKMLKDPVVQDGLKFTQSLLYAINKRR